MAKSAIQFKAYNTTIKVHKWTEELPQQAPRPGGGGGGGQESLLSATDKTVVHTVRLSGFEKMTAADIRENEHVLRERLERKACRGGPLEKLEAKQPLRAKPFAIATFKSATGEILSYYSCTTAARNSVLCIAFQDACNIVEFNKGKEVKFIRGELLKLELYSPPPEPPEPTPSELDFVISKLPVRSALSDSKLDEALDQVAWDDKIECRYLRIFRSPAGECRRALRFEEEYVPHSLLSSLYEYALFSPGAA